MSDQPKKDQHNEEKALTEKASSRKEPKEALKDLDWLRTFAEKAINENQKVKVNPEFILEVCNIIERGQQRYVDVANTADLRKEMLLLSSEQYNEIDNKLNDILNTLESDLNSQNIPQVSDAIMKLKSMVGWRNQQKKRTELIN